MKVRDVMTAEVATVHPSMSLKEVARLLARLGISGVPVVDSEGVALGVVSEGDILVKERGPHETRALFRHRKPVQATEQAKLAAETAADAMTSPAIVVGPERPVSVAAKLMLEHGVNRLPVVKLGKLVGIVTRADLVRAFTRTDAEIERELREDVLARTMWIEPGRVDVEVRNGVVTLTGRLQTRTDAELLGRLAARVPGVLSVESDVRWEIDDTTRKGRRAIESVR